MYEQDIETLRCKDKQHDREKNIISAKMSRFFVEIRTYESYIDKKPGIQYEFNGSNYYN